MPFEPFDKLLKGLGKKEFIGLSLDGKTKVRVHYQLAGSEMVQAYDAVAINEFPALPTMNQTGFAVGPEFDLAVKQAIQFLNNDQPASPARRLFGSRNRPGLCSVLTPAKMSSAGRAKTSWPFKPRCRDFVKNITGM